MTSIAPQINYKSVEPSANPKYRFLRVPLNNITGSQITVGATTSQLLEWKLPNAVYNLAQSYIGYSVGIVSQGATPNYGNIHADCLEIATNAYFGTAGGLDLCNLNYVNRYTKVWRKARTPFSEYISNDASSQLAPCNELKGVNTIGGGGVPLVNYLEPKYLDIKDAGVLNVNRMFPLKGIIDTIFSIDKDLYFPTDMYVRLTAGVGNQIAFHATANPATAPTTAALVGDVTIKNIYLYLAVEQNDLIVQSVMNKVLTSGLKLTIPYTTAFRNTVGSGAANVQISLTQQYGRKLKRMINTFWNITENGYTAMDCLNSATKISTYNTFLDQRQLQDYPLSCATPVTTAIADTDLNSIAGDWRENKVHCKDSAILNRDVYQLNWFHCDQFYQPDAKGIDDSQNDDGLLMDAPKLYSFQGTAAAAATHYAFATFVRQVMVDRNGVQFV